MTHKTVIDTPLGRAYLEGDEEGLTRLYLKNDSSPSIIPHPPVLLEAVTHLKDYFAGNLRDFDIKLNPQGTAFQKHVWRLLQDIPYGRTLSYLELAKSLGDPKAIRAVAAANGRNPLWIFIPCHRVIGSDGSLTGYAGGIWRKKWLLEHEQLEKQQKLFE